MGTRYVYLATDEFNEYVERTYGLTQLGSVRLWDAIEGAEMGADYPEGDLLTETINGETLTFRFEFAYDNDSCVVVVASEILGPQDEHVNEHAAKQRRTR
uniref:hypothetical protein n=1 Tax=Amycolatopsis sp. CA-151526 TaxID=3239921 RepID=UPI003F49674E